MLNQYSTQQNLTLDAGNLEPVNKFFFILVIEMESSRMPLASRMHFEGLDVGFEAQVLGFGLEAYKPSKTPCPRLQDSIIFCFIKNKNNRTKDNITACLSIHCFPSSFEK